ncbi:ubiquitin carboxyl-terminal hydrolase 26 [Cebus imitator]|uniref:ubiquitin carboxyl-terminal hydrolase 26 n=1 Tax=Cebus imitator TaxID=2715852 RepID=UPI00080A4612|nr:ubiquitin carboxyl-terminal hydrolase 26 [Cebus imitator]
MTAQMIHGFAQIWNSRTGMSKPKEAFIGTMEGQKKVRLVLYFKNGKYVTFLLTDNIRNVVFRSYRGNQNHLHLTLKNNKFLFVKGLSSTDAEMLKIFLDRFNQKKVRPPVRPDKGGSVFSSTTPQKKINKTSFRKVGEKSSHKSFEKAKGSGTGVLQRMPLLKSKSSALTCRKLLEKQHKKRKITLLSSSEMNEEFLKENNSVEYKKSKADRLRCVSYKQEKQLKLKELEEKKKLERESSCIINATRNPYVDDIGLLQALTEKVILAFVLQPGYSEDYSKWDKLKLFFELFPEKLCHGLPNLGNTCYMNAVLQSLFSIPSFANDILNRGFPWSKIPLNALTMSLARLLFFKDIYNIEIKEMLLLNIKKVMSAVAEIFHGNAQKDAHEFLGHCLEQLKDNTEKLDTIWKPKSEAWEYHFPKQVFADDPDTNGFSCPVITNFELELSHSIVCKACGQVILKTELSNYLSINLPQGMKALPSSIQSTFDLYFAAEELEYKCANCKHKTSVGVHSFSRLPRVLIVHLKRYSLNSFCSLKKNDQEVIISKYLTVSSHCNEGTKPPLPLSEDADIMDFQVLKVIRKMTSGSISVSWPSTKKSKDILAAYIGSDKESEQRKFQTVFKGASRRQQQKYIGKKSKPNEPESVYSGDRAFIGNKPLAYLMAYLEDISLSQCHKAGGKPTSSPDTCFPEAPFQAVPENPKQKKYVKMSKFAAFDRVFNPTKDFCEDKNIRVPEGFQKVTEQTHNYDSKRICEQVPQQAMSQSLPKPGAQGHTEKLIRSTKLNLQKPNRNSLHALGSNKNPRNKDILDRVKSKAKETERNANKGDHTYRLISVVSHLGKTLNSGHYICDAYNFEKQTWLTYNDMKVLSIQEAQMQRDRRCTGYIFFYMHNEIFEEVLKREQNAQLRSKEIEEILRKK